MRSLILSMPPHDLLGYIYAQPLLRATAAQSGEKSSDVTDEVQFLLEYVHAVLASDVAPADMKFDEARCAELFEIGRKLIGQAMHFAMATSADTKNGFFGADTAEIEFRAKSSWVILRGNRYQVLEGEFYRYVLAPHDEILNEVYGLGAVEIATGFQDMANATRSGHADAMEELTKHFDALEAFAADQGLTVKEAMESWSGANADRLEAASLAVDDMLRGGTANVSRHTKLPPKLLGDLAYQRGEETEFYACGDYSGTPYRTLPARKKPLIQLGSDYYAIDPCFTRDAGYRALLHNLLQRKPDYKKVFEEQQKTMSEGAFSDILAAQLPGATVYQEVYSKDPVTKQWSENDTLIVMDDVLFLVEAKAGAAATIASPALDFRRHALSVQDLVLKAYTQCERFFNYLNSADEVPIYHLIEGKYQECGRLRGADYRVKVPIGLTVESFSPFSAYCKELPQVKPLLGKYAFISLSIDDLFVLKRFLPTPGSLVHYFEVRQSMAGMRRAHLFDEFDHLGAYITNNRFDLEMASQMKADKADMLIWDGMSHIIDKSFEGEDWDTRPFPSQSFPEEVSGLLGALNATRAPGWLSADSKIRNYGEKGRKDLAEMLISLGKTLKQHPARYFLLAGENEPLFFWLQDRENETDWNKINEKASAAALALNEMAVSGVMVEVDVDGTFTRQKPFL